MKLKTLFFVVGIAPTPEETAAIIALAEKGANVEVLSVEKMESDAPVNLFQVEALAGSVPTNYADAFKAQGPAVPPATVEALGTAPQALFAAPPPGASVELGAAAQSEAAIGPVTKRK